MVLERLRVVIGQVLTPGIPVMYQRGGSTTVRIDGANRSQCEPLCIGLGRADDARGWQIDSPRPWVSVGLDQLHGQSACGGMRASRPSSVHNWVSSSSASTRYAASYALRRSRRCAIATTAAVSFG